MPSQSFIFFSVGTGKTRGAFLCGKPAQQQKGVNLWISTKLNWVGTKPEFLLFWQRKRPACPESKAKSAQIATTGALLKSGVTASTTDAERARPRKSCTKHLTAFVMPLKFLAEDGHQQIQCGLKYLILPICSKLLKIGFSS